MDVELTRIHRSALVTVRGEMDLASATRLFLILDACWRSGIQSVVCDLTDLEVPPVARLLTVFPAGLHRGGGWPTCDLRLAAASSVVTELATNGLRHGRAPVDLALSGSPSHLTVAVSDCHPAAPQPRPLDVVSVDGRGMHIVQALSDSWGVRCRHKAGTTVWADLTATC